MPAIDAKKKAAAIEKAMFHARKGLSYLAAEIGSDKGSAGKEIAGLLVAFQKIEAAFLKAADGLPEGGKEISTYAEAVKGDMDGIRRAMMDIVTEVGTKAPPGKDIANILTDFQKIEARFKTAAKTL